MEENGKWISAYLFYSHSACELIRDFIPLFIESVRLENSLSRFFFIRYNESGPHIRLRVKIESSLETNWRQKLESEWKYFIALHITKETSARPMPPANKYLIKFVAYQPEYERYGGFQVMAAAEMQFEGSSKAILMSITDCAHWTKKTELILALKMNIVFFLSLDFSTKAMMEICKIFIQEWLPTLYDPGKPASEEKSFFLLQFNEKFTAYRDQIVPAVSQFLDDFRDGKSRHEILTGYYLVNQQVKVIYERNGYDLTKKMDIITSFMHMTHNRIGISNADEAYLIYLLYKCLENLTTDE
jgi:thiopeptide-type bacteriocin biosynthesis protein